MDLFVINRFLGDDRTGEITSVEERNRLAQLLSKVEERKKRKGDVLNAQLCNTESATTDTIPPQTKKKRKKKEILKEFEDVDIQVNDELAVTKSEEKQAEGFTVLGYNQFQKKLKVKRVLPYWLANPTVISVNLQEVGTSVDDIPDLDVDLVQRLKENHLNHFFPVQSKVIPWLVAAHKKPLWYRPCDVCVSSPTGSGKTLAFVLPIIQALKERVVPHVRALIVLPVQDLAVQVFKVFKTYCLKTALKVALITGQNSFQKEQQQLVKTGGVLGEYSAVDIVVTTPGRLVDHIQSTSGFSLKYLRFLVIDEADRVMESAQNDWLYHLEKHINSGSRAFLTVSSLEMECPSPPQKLLFSATLSQDPEKLQQLGLFQPKLFTSVVGEEHPVEGIDKIRRDFVGKYTTPAELKEKMCTVTMLNKPLVLYHLIVSNKWQHVLCFAHSHLAAHRLTLLLSHLAKSRFKVAEISAALNRSTRNDILQKFALGELDIIISTDALARGMDIAGVDYVISYDPPKHVKTYIHRVGRTGRAGRLGTAVTFILDHQKSHFQQLLHTAGKTQVEEMDISEAELKPYKKVYTEALQSLGQDLQEERNKMLRKVKALKHASSKKLLLKKKGRRLQ